LDYLDACLYNVKSLKVSKKKASIQEENLNRLKSLSKLNLQYCAMLSKLKKHKQAYKRARIAYKHISEAFEVTNHLLGKSQSRLSLKASMKPSSKQSQKISILQKAAPIMKAIGNFFKQNRISTNVEMRSTLGVKGYPEWTYSLEMSEVMLVSPSTPDDYKSEMGLQAEFTKDYLLYKTLILGLSYYCMGTELKLLKELRKGEELIHSSTRIIKAFFPSNCPILSQIKESIKHESSEEEIGRASKLQKPKRKPKKTIRPNKSFLVRRSSLKEPHSRPNSSMSHVSPKKMNPKARRKKNKSMDARNEERLHVD